MKSGYPVVDLFCGIGGLSYGFGLENFNLIAGIDFDVTCRYAYEKNNNATFLHQDLTTISSNYIKGLYPKKQPKILIGCAPCQAFSALSNKYKNNDKWKLLYSFGRIIKEVKPDIISMENVPRLLRYAKGKVFEDFLAVLKEENYSVTHKIVNTADYGVPQNRNRLILLASKYGDIELLKETHDKSNYVTVKKAISHLPPIKAGETSKTDILHTARSLSDINLKRIKATPQGGGWKDWDKELILECHKKKSGKSFRSVYGRMKWSEVAPTLTTQCTGYGNGRFGHPIQDRAISLREAAILQSFPEKYEFIEPKKRLSVSNIERHIGNAVPVALGSVIAKSIKKHLAKHGYK
jgi:DNA (cytosine-5)-methyltransferase 1